MRLLLQLKSLKASAYDTKYFHKLQGLIYNSIQPYYNQLHDKNGFKFFCFSNIFPIQEMKEGDCRTLLISSPDSAFLKILRENLTQEINIGDMSFKIEESHLITPKLNLPSRVLAATPIVMRIPQWSYSEYDIQSNKSYVYWRKSYPFNAFIKQIEANLFKKYNEFHQTSLEEFPIFEQFIFKKETCNPIIINGKEYPLIGSIWEFLFNNLSKDQRKLLEFGLDCGFGERNSLGFGFVNVLRGG